MDSTIYRRPKAHISQPHDVPDITKWADTVQEVVTAIRAVAKNQAIALPGNEYVFTVS